MMASENSNAQAELQTSPFGDVSWELLIIILGVCAIVALAALILFVGYIIYCICSSSKRRRRRKSGVQAARANAVSILPFWPFAN